MFWFVYLFSQQKTVSAEVAEATVEYNKTLLLEEHVEKQYCKFALVLWWETGEHSVMLSSAIPDKRLFKNHSLTDYFSHGASSDEREFSVVKQSGKYLYYLDIFK